MTVLLFVKRFTPSKGPSLSFRARFRSEISRLNSKILRQSLRILVKYFLLRVYNKMKFKFLLPLLLNFGHMN